VIRRGLMLVVIAAFPACPLFAPAEDPNPLMILDVRMRPTIETMIIAEAVAFGVPAHLVLGVAWSESRFNPDVISSAGAMGVMQLMPLTVRVLGVRDPFNARENIHGGVGLFAAYYRVGGERFARCAYAQGPSECHAR
jgi:soluble lytic murein transglycosylase-like protein